VQGKASYSNVFLAKRYHLQPGEPDRDAHAQQ
jgi:hypothetical protein